MRDLPDDKLGIARTSDALVAVFNSLSRDIDPALVARIFIEFGAGAGCKFRDPAEVADALRETADRLEAWASTRASGAPGHA